MKMPFLLPSPAFRLTCLAAGLLAVAACGKQTPQTAPEAAAAADANATLTLTKDIFIRMMAGTAGIKDTLMSDDLQVDGSKIDLVRFFSLIDKAAGTFAIVTRG